MPNYAIEQGKGKPFPRALEGGGAIGGAGGEAPCWGQWGQSPRKPGVQGYPLPSAILKKWYNLLQSFDLLLFEQNFSLIAFGKFCDKLAI